MDRARSRAAPVHHAAQGGRGEPESAPELGPDQCLDLLASRRVGRVGISIGALPVILPVNYAVFDHGVLFRTAAGTKLDAAVRGIVVAFEADAYDPDGRAGWSVLLVGKASEVSDPVKLERAEAAADVSMARCRRATALRAYQG